MFETYSGEWVQDQRHGFGVCERSDGVMYEGGWLNNKRHGFGITKFSDGSFEEGQYQNGKLVFLWTKRNPIFFLHSFRLGLQIKKSVKQARNASKRAQEKDMECRKKLVYFIISFCVCHLDMVFNGICVPIICGIIIIGVSVSEIDT